MDQKHLGCSREGINSQICLKIGIPKAWVNPSGCVFIFFKNLIFLALARQFQAGNGRLWLQNLIQDRKSSKTQSKLMIF